MKRLIIDCDPGNGIAGANIDDGLALALAIASPDISLELITTVAGNTPADVGYCVAQDLVQRLQLNIPVLKGAEKALLEPTEPWRKLLDKSVHQLNLSHLWQGVRRPPRQVAPNKHAIEAMGELIYNNPSEITLVAIGPLTNVARAMQRYPQLAKKVAEIVIMGGVFTLDHYLKDTNFGLDPEAAHQVLNSGANITLVPMDATTQTMMTRQDLTRITDIGTPLAQFIGETCRPWIEYAMTTRGLPGCWIHDALVVAWLINPLIATITEYFVDIERRTGPTRGRLWRYRPPLRVNIGIDASAGARVNMLNCVDNLLLLNTLERVLTPR